MVITDDYLANNAKCATIFVGLLSMLLSKHVAVVVCMDARLDVYRLLGLNERRPTSSGTSDGVVTDNAISSPAISQRLLRTR